MSEQVTEASTTPQKRVRLRPETDLKLAAITARMRWTDTEAVDALCDEFMAQHGISVTNAAQPTTGQQDSIAAPLIRGDTTDAPAQQGEDMQSEDGAGTKPTAGTESQEGSSPGETFAESA